jgi:hypothetical protein
VPEEQREKKAKAASRARPDEDQPAKRAAAARAKRDAAARAEEKQRVRAERQRREEEEHSVRLASRLQRIESALSKQSELTQTLHDRIESLVAADAESKADDKR